MASIHKRVTAKGEIRWLVRYRDPNKVERTRSFRLKTDAARFAAAVETDISRGDWVNPELARETFSYWADQWLATTYHLKPKTQEGYQSVLNHHLLPRLAHTSVARIDLPMITSLLSELSRNGAGAGTVGNIRGALGLVLEQARRWTPTDKAWRSTDQAGDLDAFNRPDRLRMPRSLPDDVDFVSSTFSRRRA